MIKVIPFIYEDLDDLYANTYVLIDEDKNCVVIDPAKDNNSINAYVKKNELDLKAILLTHGHIDHMRGAEIIYHEFKCPVYIGFYDVDKLKDPYGNCSMLLGKRAVLSIPAQTLADQQVLNLLNESIVAIETPYHTAGSICYYLKDSGLLFSGDFILEHSVGRSDLPGSMPRELRRSMGKILVLPKSTKIYPGHGKASTLEIELNLNPFVK